MYVCGVNVTVCAVFIATFSFLTDAELVCLRTEQKTKKKQYSNAQQATVSMRIVLILSLCRIAPALDVIHCLEPITAFALFYFTWMVSLG